MNHPWYLVEKSHLIPSPSLLVYVDRVKENIRRMIRMAGGAERLRPHVKTHKMPELVRLQIAMGITRFKCATIAEAEMLADCGAADVLLAYQMVGPNQQRFIQLMQRFPQTVFSTLADDAGVIRELSAAASQAGMVLPLWLDLDCGMNRSGIEPGPDAAELYRLLHSLPGLRPCGLHMYDGHIADTNPAGRQERCDQAFARVATFREELRRTRLPVPAVVAGGTPTFPLHAARPGVECSPGTTVFWDFGYAQKLPDLDFLPAALVLTRVVSKPGRDRLCLDLGHKAIAAENPQPRVQLLGLANALPVGHSEEHLLLETNQADAFALGSVLYGIPRHICPTVALYSHAVIIEGGNAVGRWEITARNRELSI